MNLPADFTVVHIVILPNEDIAIGYKYTTEHGTARAGVITPTIIGLPPRTYDLGTWE